MDDAEGTFKNPAIKWDFEFARHSLAEVGTPAHRGRVFVPEDEAARS
jgi:hypothetical protein